MPTIGRLGRDAAHRWAMLKTMVSQLIQHERIETTLPKAKELRKVADRVVTFAKRGGRNDRLQASRVIGDEELLNKLWTVMGPRYIDRPGGYTRVLRSRKRFGDNATMAFIEFVDRPGELRIARQVGNTRDVQGHGVTESQDQPQTLIDEEKIVSDPSALNPNQNPKSISIVHLARCNISAIANFQQYINLEVLYLNDNRLQKVENLDQCFRLRELYLHRNRLVTLSGLDKLRYLRKLTLNGNQLKNLITMLPNLRHMHLLNELDLFGNPLANEHHYRLHVLHTLPSLAILDHQAITKSDHDKAARLYRDRRVANSQLRVVFGRRLSVEDLHSTSSPQHGHVVSSLSEAMVKKAKKIEEQLLEQKKKQLLSLYGECGENLSADDNAIPLPSRFHSFNLDLAKGVSSKVDLRDTLRAETLTRTGIKESSTIAVAEATRLIVDLQSIGRRPLPEDFQKVLERWSKVATQPESTTPVSKNATPSSSEPSIPVSTFLDDITALEWSPQPVDELRVLYDKHHGQALASFTSGNHAAALRSITLALAVQQLISES